MVADKYLAYFPFNEAVEGPTFVPLHEMLECWSSLLCIIPRFIKKQSMG